MSDGTIILYGATGFTGHLTARKMAERDMPPVLAGRTPSKLDPIATELGLSTRVFGVDDRGAMDEALADATVLLNCAGPFPRTAGPLIDGCLRTKTHYLDIAGEAPEFEAVAQRDRDAKAAGVMLMPGVGFGVVPTDAIALYLKEKLPTATHLSIAFEAVGGVSQGSAEVVFTGLMTAGHKRRDGKLVAAQPAEQTVSAAYSDGTRKAVTNPWRGDLSTAYHTTGIPNIDTYITMPGPLAGLMRAHGALGWLWNSGPFQGFLKRAVRFLPAGPNDKQLENGATHIWAEVRDDEGDCAAAHMLGPEAYLYTALTAHAVTQRVLAGELTPGFQTPAALYGADFPLAIEGVMRADVPCS